MIVNRRSTGDATTDLSQMIVSQEVNLPVDGSD
jgi:hypothetical protein